MAQLTTPIQPWHHSPIRAQRSWAPALSLALALLFCGCTDVEGLKVVPRPDLSGQNTDNEDNTQTNPGDRNQDNDGSNNSENNSDTPEDTGAPVEEFDTGEAPSMPVDDAELVWVDLPTDLNCAESYIATVQMKNIGTNT